jgi:hypothetical protein
LPKKIVINFKLADRSHKFKEMVDTLKKLLIFSCLCMFIQNPEAAETLLNEFPWSYMLLWNFVKTEECDCLSASAKEMINEGKPERIIN